MNNIFPKPAGGLPAIKLRRRKDQIKSLDPNKRKKRERETQNQNRRGNGITANTENTPK